MKEKTGNFVQIELPENVKRIIQVLSENGYEAYAVGGCVRDSLIGKEPEDWDITTSALPSKVKSLFRRTVDTGIAHGTVTVMFGKTGYEVTTYRLDGLYEDMRHPKNVEFTSNLAEDLKRRDFTVNAMAYNEESGLVDLFGGISDLKDRIIRCVGAPKARFGEDALRILRAVRFCAQLGFDIEKQTAEAVAQMAPSLEKISKERIHTELNKILKSENPEYFLLADELGIMETILPKYHALSRKQKEFSAAMAGRCACELPERYGAMFLFVEQESKKAADTAAGILKELKLDNATVNMTAALIRWHGVKLTSDEAKIRRIMHEAGPDRIVRILRFRLAYQETKEGLSSEHIADDGSQAVLRQIERCQVILQRGDCLTLKELMVTGRDLMELGVPAGKRIGEILEKLLCEVLDNPAMNTKDTLCFLAKKYINKIPLS